MFKIKAAGIYIIEIDEYYYIGCSVDIFSRWQSHYSELKMNKHHSPKLQSSYNDWGISKMSFRVLEYISITEYKKSSNLKGEEAKKGFKRHLLHREKEWMEKYSINFALNRDNKNFS